MRTRELSDFYSLVGKTALITGGGSGLGLAVAEDFAQQGMAGIPPGRWHTIRPLDPWPDPSRRWMG